jgi:hypothetical protein|tara:strand:+ start:563 stop:1012 length:450 start_codon:yes stop_codon:yes gene_type:complete
MRLRYGTFIAGALLGLLVGVFSQPAQADAEFNNLIIGSIIGGVLVNEFKQDKRVPNHATIILPDGTVIIPPISPINKPSRKTSWPTYNTCFYVDGTGQYCQWMDLPRKKRNRGLTDREAYLKHYPCGEAGASFGYGIKGCKKWIESLSK